MYSLSNDNIFVKWFIKGKVDIVKFMSDTYHLNLQVNVCTCKVDIYRENWFLEFRFMYRDIYIGPKQNYFVVM